MLRAPYLPTLHSHCSVSLPSEGAACRAACSMPVRRHACSTAGTLHAAVQQGVTAAGLPVAAPRGCVLGLRRERRPRRPCFAALHCTEEAADPALRLGCCSLTARLLLLCIWRTAICWGCGHSRSCWLDAVCGFPKVGIADCTPLRCRLPGPAPHCHKACLPAACSPFQATHPQ